MFGIIKRSNSLRKHFCILCKVYACGLLHFLLSFFSIYLKIFFVGFVNKKYNELLLKTKKTKNINPYLNYPHSFPSQKHSEIIFFLTSVIFIRIFLKMKAACHCHQNLNICLKCTTHPCPKPATNTTRTTEIEQLTKKYSMLMENQLSKLSETKQAEIDELNQTISQLKMALTKFEVRSNLDRNSERQLRDKIVSKDDRIRELENQIFELQNTQGKKKETIEQVIKEVIVKVPVESGLSKQDIDGLYAQNAQLKASLQQKQIIYLEKGAQILRELKDNKQQIADLNQNLTNLQELLKSKTNQIQKLKKDNKYLQERIEILVKPHTRNIEPVIINKIDHPLPQVETVYIDRPVFQTKIVEIDKIINHFIQPERPIVNRIIQCQKQQPQSNRNYLKEQSVQQQQQLILFDEISKKYEDVIHGYQNERQELVKQIRERDHDYHLLTKKAELCQKINNNSNRGNSWPCVDVEVTVLKNQNSDKVVENDGKNVSKYGRTTTATKVAKGRTGRLV